MRESAIICSLWVVCAFLSVRSCTGRFRLQLFRSLRLLGPVAFCGGFGKRLEEKCRRLLIAHNVKAVPNPRTARGGDAFPGLACPRRLPSRAQRGADSLAGLVCRVGLRGRGEKRASSKRSDCSLRSLVRGVSELRKLRDSACGWWRGRASCRLLRGTLRQGRRRTGPPRDHPTTRRSRAAPAGIGGRRGHVGCRGRGAIAGRACR